jgi:D-alanyl-D-alanine carboxypeptidase
MKKLIAVAFIFATIALAAFPVLADGASEEAIPVNVSASPLSVSAPSAILMEQSTGKILYEKNSHEKIAPASITKIMTLLLTFEALEEGRFSLSDMVATSEHAASMGGSQIWLEIGESMSVNDILKAAVIRSANDASVVLAELVSGSEEVFVSLMNKRAKELSMTDTVFMNASGLDAEGQVSSAHDVALMSRELMKHSIITQYSTVWMDTLRDGTTELTNTNKLVRFYDGCTGLKTGTTSQAGYCLSATATRGGLSLISVVMNAENTDDRFNDARKLLDYGFANFTFAIPEMPELLPVKINHGVRTSIIPQLFEQPGIVVLKGREADIVATSEYEQVADAPIEQGQTLGKLVYTLDGEVIAEIPIMSANKVERLSFWLSFSRMFTAVFG